jgi:prepilin-type N-terminal cleavage/methylation domain-containing protein
MKLTNTHSMKAKSGMTLLELTVVILVLLSLISILFVGARAWKKGSDRSANIMNIRNTQQAMRGHQNTRELLPSAPFVQADLEDYMKFPKNIGAGTATDGVGYTPGTVITAASATPAVNTDHIWLQVTALGEPGLDYGQNAVTDSTGW